MIAVSTALRTLILASVGGLVWVVWHWARGHDAITRSDHYERRNY